MQIPRWDCKQQPPAQLALRTEASQPLSDVWIKVGLLPSCLYNNTLDRSSAAVGACGSDYLASRRSLWLVNGPGTVPFQVPPNKSADRKLGRTPETLKTASYLLLSISHSAAWQVVHASFLLRAYCPESQPEPVNWTDLNCHWMFVAAHGAEAASPRPSVGKLG